MSKYKIVALIGESGCGKDTILNRVVSEYSHIFHKIITSTTRPPREREVGGFHYHFYNNNEDFIKKINCGDTIEHSVFNDWYYGTCKDDLNINKINIGVFNPTAVRALLKNEDCDVLVLYVRVSDKERLLRQLNREEDPNTREIVRRALADYKDFENLEFQYETIPNQTSIDLWEAPEAIAVQTERKFAQGQDRLID